MEYKHLFGPVPSRRIGISLGIDLVPYKTCTYDCIYCECGKTTNLTLSRKEYVPTDEIIKELDHFLSKTPELDYITFSGSGEPTLHTGIGKIVEFLRKNYPQYETALLTNGSLLSIEEVKNSIMEIDLIMPSFDAYSVDIIEKINRPPKEFDRDKYQEGFLEFFQDYQGETKVEIFIVKGINDTEEEIRKIDDFLAKTNIDSVQLNTLDRPGTEDWIEPVDRESLQKIKSYFRKNNVEIIAKFHSRKKSKAYHSDIKQQIISTITRRPCTARDLSDVLGLHINEINKYLDVLVEDEEIEIKKLRRGNFYQLKQK